jgi:selenocysteine lyase/cysteine desulfurase
MGKRTKVSTRNLAERKIFFNYATVGMIDKVAYRAAVHFLEEYIKIGPPEVLEKYDAYPAKLAKEAAKLLNCDAEEISYVKNTTEGIIIASEALPLSPGDEVLLLGHEYPANLLPWLKKKKDGIDVKIITAEDNHHAFLKMLESITPKTKAVSISWGQYYDGYIPDLELLSKVCMVNDAFLVVDGVHGVGTKQLDLQKIHVDILSCGGQKTLGALPGIGFIYVNKNIIEKLKDFKVGIRSVKNFNLEGYHLKDATERFQDGTQNLIGIVSLYAAIKHINKEGMENIERRNTELLNAYKNILRESSINFINYENQANIISLHVPDPRGLALFLRERGIYIKFVEDVARISFSHASKVEDFAQVVERIKEWINIDRIKIIPGEELQSAEKLTNS